jgi:lipoyl(octanoyl) transferase
LLNFIGEGTIPYAEAWKWQQKLLDHHVSLQEGGGEMPSSPNPTAGSVLIVEHDPVYTLGTATTEGSGPFQPSSAALSFEKFEVERAGEATYHGPGQLVVYPILDLAYFSKDINTYLRRMEQVVIDSVLESIATCKASSASNNERGGGCGSSSNNIYMDGDRRDGDAVVVGRMEGLTGVWAGNLKVAAMGIKLRRWVTMHGVSVNVDPDMRYFQNIVPCGVRDADKGVTSLRGLGLGVDRCSVQQYCDVYCRHFVGHFGAEFVEALDPVASRAFLEKL